MNYDILEILSGNIYPGRGILIGRSKNGSSIISMYFIMGRSENSRNRIFEKTSDGIRTCAFNKDKLIDPSLIIYNPVRLYRKYQIITNGDQTDSILRYLKNGSDYYTALKTRDYEPDSPIYTPRISAIINFDTSYSLSIIKKASEISTCSARYFFEYSEFIPGTGHFISVYKTDGDPPPSFDGEPIPTDITYNDNIDLYTSEIWNSLNSINKVALYVRVKNIITGCIQEKIINKFEEN